MKKIITILFLAAIFSSCYKAEMNLTDHPDSGKLIVAVLDPVFPAGAVDTDVPTTYTATLNGEELQVSGNEVDFPDYLSEGEYTVYVYNEPAGVSIANMTSVGESGEIVASVPLSGDESGVVIENPDHLFFGVEIVKIKNDRVTETYVSMDQITRDLLFEITAKGDDLEYITEVKATLDGVAQQWDCVSDVAIGEAHACYPPLEWEDGNAPGAFATRSDINTPVLTGSVRLLGITGAAQTLKLEVIFSNGNSQIIKSDISGKLTTFNDNKIIPMTLRGEFELNKRGVVIDDPLTIINWITTTGSVEAK